MDEFDLKPLDVPGYIYLKIRARDTPANNAVHQSFRTMARIECDNDYTQGIAKLLEYYQADAKTEMLWREVQRLSAEIAQINKKLETPAKTVDERF